ncbi:hypothetical protein CAEBREN_24606 [Caenorhabditis brenneri]|uniref:Uncharacterized protein n=1 Tax=Caenorhabditis brenneri TaxID=135651 RepID=G0NKQ9_CAEBE|nr:hypothetical protein CAEBREN_24606 [Caenorhabditis brenneri]
MEIEESAEVLKTRRGRGEEKREEDACEN